MKRSAIVFGVLSLILFGCAEENFSSKRQKINEHISFATTVIEMEDLDVTRGGGHHNAAHHHDMTGAATPVFARFTQTNNVDKYLKTGRLGVHKSQETRDDTRGRRIDSIPDFYDDFGLISFLYDNLDTWAGVGSSLTPYVYNERVRRADMWQTKEYWPGSGGNLTFFAYAPYNAQGVTLSPNTNMGTPWLHHVVPDEAQDQSDLLISANEHEVGNYNAIRKINFRHICAGVRFGIGSQMAPGTITKIQLDGVYGEGTYTFGESAWDTVYNKKTFTLNQTFSIALGESNRLLTNSDNVFMMVPQEVPSMAKIIVTIDDGEEHTLTSLISHDHWDIGTTTTYWLSTMVSAGDTILSVAVENAPIASAGGTAQYEVSSYYTTAYGTRTAIPWTATYELPDGQISNTPADVVTAFQSSGTGMTGNSIGETHNISLVINHLKSSPTETHTAALRANGTATGITDLAAGKETANCYVINRAGTYSLPLVYGNARKADGSANTAAYASNTFVDYQGNHITSPYLPVSNVGDACIVWQDAPDLIIPTSLRLSAGKDSLIFTIDHDNICQGNAVLAVRDASGIIMWSWHIWITDEDITPESYISFLNQENVDYKLMKKPLGWCYGETRTSEARSVKIHVAQSIGTKIATADVVQSGGASVTYYENAVFYQQGRKDPMPGGMGGNSEDKILYNNVYGFPREHKQATTQEAIQHPYAFYYMSNTDWSSQHQYDYWDGHSTPTSAVDDYIVVKTIYDPSPSGFRMPDGYVFTGFLKTNNSKNVSGSFDKGWNFYTTQSSGSSTVFWPALGYRDDCSCRPATQDGKLMSVNSLGNYSTAKRIDNNNNRSTEFGSSNIYTRYSMGLGYGCSAWPVVDEPHSYTP